MEGKNSQSNFSSKSEKSVAAKILQTITFLSSLKDEKNNLAAGSNRVNILSDVRIQPAEQPAANKKTEDFSDIRDLDIPPFHFTGLSSNDFKKCDFDDTSFSNLNLTSVFEGVSGFSPTPPPPYAPLCENISCDDEPVVAGPSGLNVPLKRKTPTPVNSQKSSNDESVVVGPSSLNVPLTRNTSTPVNSPKKQKVSCEKAFSDAFPMLRNALVMPSTSNNSFGAASPSTPVISISSGGISPTPTNSKNGTVGSGDDGVWSQNAEEQWSIISNILEDFARREARALATNREAEAKLVEAENFVIAHQKKLKKSESELQKVRNLLRKLEDEHKKIVREGVQARQKLPDLKAETARSRLLLKRERKRVAMLKRKIGLHGTEPTPPKQ